MCHLSSSVSLSIAKEERGKGGGKEEEVFHRGRLSQLDIGGAITSLYVLGGMMTQQPHIGMPVRVHHQRYHVS